MIVGSTKGRKQSFATGQRSNRPRGCLARRSGVREGDQQKKGGKGTPDFIFEL